MRIRLLAHSSHFLQCLPTVAPLDFQRYSQQETGALALEKLGKLGMGIGHQRCGRRRHPGMTVVAESVVREWRERNLAMATFACSHTYVSSNRRS